MLVIRYLIATYLQIQLHVFATALLVSCAERSHSHVGPIDNANLWTLSVLNSFIEISFALAINWLRNPGINSNDSC
jgi:midasin (ATPase involved in ribosome maturation)